MADYSIIIYYNEAIGRSMPCGRKIVTVRTDTAELYDWEIIEIYR
jgi:hypothetical protein